MKKITQMLLTLLLLFVANAWAATPEEFKFEVTVDAGATFRIPLSGNANSTSTQYNWNIDWGDQTATEIFTQADVQSGGNRGIPHNYATAGTYQITITPAGSTDAWLKAFGFYSNTMAVNEYANKAMVTKVISPLTPLMTRMQAHITGNSAVDNEWNSTFYGCVNLTMGPDFTFAPEWNSITTVGWNFAFQMFYNVTGANFTMNSVFNLPQGITTVGNNFAYSMFGYVTGSAFTMNSVFNLPPNITTVGNSFAQSMFYSVTGTSFTMNSVFNLPQGITTVGNSFASGMFYSNWGSEFTMNSVFNLPQGITTVGETFAYEMFSGTSGTSFTMNSVFNLPQGITTVGSNFASSMFLNNNGAAFRINDAFKFPKLPQAELDKSNVFYQTFYNLNAVIANRQPRTIESIVNGNPIPSQNRSTFGISNNSNNTFIDRPYAPTQWGGGGNPAVISVATQPASTAITYGEQADLSVAATATQSATLSYQWHSNTDNDNSGGTEIEGETSATLNVTPNAGTHYYYCVISGNNWAGHITSNVATVTVNQKEVPLAELTIGRHAKGDKQAEAHIEASEQYITVKSASWSPGEETFRGGIVYTATVTLEINNPNYIFASEVEATVNEQAAEATKNDDGTITITHTFPETDTRTATKIEIASALEKTSYTHGDVLDLSGLAIKTTYDDGTTATRTIFEFLEYGGNINIADHEEPITHAEHNGFALKASLNAFEVAIGTLSVAKKTLTVTGVTASNRSYAAGSTTVTFTGGNLVGLVEGDVVTIAARTGTIANANAGAGKAVTAAITLGGADAGNYTLTQPEGITVTISKLPLTITAESKSVTLGDAAPTYTAAYSGFAIGETASDLTGELTFTAAYTAASEPGTYDITPSGLSSPNYEITYVKGTLTVAEDQTPIRLPQLAASGTIAYASGSAIILQNLPRNAKVRVYNLKGKQIHSANPGNLKILQIGVQTGVYVVKVNNQTLRIAVK